MTAIPASAFFSFGHRHINALPGSRASASRRRTHAVPRLPHRPLGPQRDVGLELAAPLVSHPCRLVDPGALARFSSQHAPLLGPSRRPSSLVRNLAESRALRCRLMVLADLSPLFRRALLLVAHRHQPPSSPPLVNRRRAGTAARGAPRRAVARRRRRRGRARRAARAAATRSPSTQRVGQRRRRRLRCCRLGEWCFILGAPLHRCGLLDATVSVGSCSSALPGHRSQHGCRAAQKRSSIGHYRLAQANF